MNPSTEWHWVLGAPRTQWGSAVAIAIAVAILWLGWRASRSLPARRWGALLWLRTVGALAALVLFFQPVARFEQVARRPNHVAVLVDTSESMRIVDAGKKDRLARASALIRDSESAFSQWRDHHRVEFFRFGAEVESITREGLEKKDLPLSGATRIGEALESIRSRYAGPELAGIVLISDGIDRGSLSDMGVADRKTRIKALGAPVHTVWAAEPSLADISIAKISHNDFAFVRTSTKIEATIRVSGDFRTTLAQARTRAALNMSEEATLPVDLRCDGQRMQTQAIVLDGKKEEYKVTFNVTANHIGRYLYEISVPVLDGEAIAENNRRGFVFDVIREKIRVLQVAGRPSWDVRFLRSLLKRNPNVDLISFFILRTPGDIEMVSPDELSLIPFPTDELFREQLPSFDVLFFQNFNPLPYGVGEYLGQIQRFVEGGGGLAVIGGDLAFGSGQYAGTPIGAMLPVDLFEGAPEDLLDPRAFKIQLTPTGKRHPLTILELDPAQNEKRWQALPPLVGANVVRGARADASVSATHPTLKDRTGAPLPVLSVRHAGQGRVLSLLSDATWRWGFGVSKAAAELRDYERFWQNAMNWLIGDPTFDFLRVEALPSEAWPNDPVRLRVQTVDASYGARAGVPVQLSVQRLSEAGPVPTASPTGITDDAGRWETELKKLAPGGYRARASAQLDGRTLEAETKFWVHGFARELDQPQGRRDLIEEIATHSGGEFRKVDDGLANLTFPLGVMRRIGTPKDVELWSGGWMLLLAVGAWLAEWTLRRRWALT